MEKGNDALRLLSKRAKQLEKQMDFAARNMNSAPGDPVIAHELMAELGEKLRDVRNAYKIVNDTF